MTLSTFVFAFALVLLSGLSTSIGGALAVGKRQPGSAFMAAALGLSAGVMLYVSFMEILPEGISQLSDALGGEVAGTWAAVGAFFAGIAVIAIIGILAAIARQRPVPVYFIGVGEKVEDKAQDCKDGKC